ISRFLQIIVPRRGWEYRNKKREVEKAGANAGRCSVMSGPPRLARNSCEGDLMLHLVLRSLGIRTAALVLSVFVLAAASADEPGVEPKKDKPAPLTLVNKAKDIRVVSDRDEAILDYFRRNHIIIGGVQAKELNKIFEAKETLTKFFVNYASYNDAPEKASLFGANL